MKDDEFVKDPDATLDYLVNWSDWLLTDTIVTSTWTVPTGITKVSDTNTTTTATIWLSSGIVGVVYDCINKIITASARTDQRTIHVYVLEK